MVIFHFPLKTLTTITMILQMFGFLFTLALCFVIQINKLIIIN